MTRLSEHDEAQRARRGPGLGVKPDKNQRETTKADAIQRVLSVSGEYNMFPGTKAVWTQQRFDSKKELSTVRLLPPDTRIEFSGFVARSARYSPNRPLLPIE